MLNDSFIKYFENEYGNSNIIPRFSLFKIHPLYSILTDEQRKKLKFDFGLYQFLKFKERFEQIISESNIEPTRMLLDSFNDFDMQYNSKGIANFYENYLFVDEKNPNIYLQVNGVDYCLKQYVRTQYLKVYFTVEKL